MNGSEEFRAKVERRAPPHLPAEAVEAAIAHHEDRGWIRNPDVNNCVQLAGRFADYSPAVKERTQVPPGIEQATPWAEAWGAELLEECTPWIQDRVTAILGRPPWLPNEYAAAVAWIEERAGELKEKRREAREFKKSDRYRLLRDQLWDVSQELSGHLFEAFGTVGYRLHLRYLDRKDRFRAVLVPYLGTGPLSKLARLQHGLTQLGGFYEEDLLAYVLCGRKPPFERVRLEYGSGQIEYPIPPSIKIRRVLLTFFAPDLSNDDLRQLRVRIKDAWREMGIDLPDDANGPQGPRLTETDRKRAAAVEKIGGVPEEPTRDFWQHLHTVLGLPRDQDPDSLRKWWKSYQDKRRQVPLPNPGAGGEDGTPA